jgi:lipid-binding SYLF domain-containing protein
MRNRRETYVTLTAAAALACAAARTAAQDEGGRIEQTAPPRVEQELLDNQHVGADLDVDPGADVGEARRADQEQTELEEILDDAQEIVARRDELVRMTDRTIEELRREQESAAELLERAHGYAVFDTTKGGLIVTGAGGTGVAREQDSGEEIFMHLGAVGVGLGAGLENYKLVMLFEDQETYDAFVAGRWDGSIAAQAAAGNEGAAAEEQFVEGIRIYRMTDVGLMVHADVSGIRFWPSERLNGAAHDA